MTICYFCIFQVNTSYDENLNWFEVGTEGVISCYKWLEEFDNLPVLSHPANYKLYIQLKN